MKKVGEEGLRTSEARQGEDREAAEEADEVGRVPPRPLQHPPVNVDVSERVHRLPTLQHVADWREEG